MLSRSQLLEATMSADKVLATLNKAILQTIDQEICEKDKEKRRMLWHKELALRRMKREWIKSKQPRVEEPDDKTELVEIIEIPDEQKLPELEDGVKEFDAMHDEKCW